MMNKIAILLSLSATVLGQRCCRAMTLDCLSCAKDASPEEYCDHPIWAKEAGMVKVCEARFPESEFGLAVDVRAAVSTSAVGVCGINEVWETCGSSSCWEDSCSDDPSQPKACTYDCRQGCRCADGFVRSSEGICIRRWDCAVGPPVTKTIYVAATKATCFGAFGPQQCMQTRDGSEEEWTLFYDSIRGFEYEPGFEYQLSVRVQERANPPMDASSMTYDLVQVISKTPPFRNTCGANQVWETCGSSSCWEFLCGDDPSQPRPCTADCRQGCRCAEGFVRGAAGTCIPRSACPSIPNHGNGGQTGDLVRFPAVSTIRSTSAVLTWLAPAGGFQCGTDTYRVELRRLRGPGRWKQVPLHDPSDPVAMLTNLKPGTRYRLRVTAITAAGEGQGVTTAFRTKN